jgi:capsule polysaccharide export protein KpsE/RkpR
VRQVRRLIGCLVNCREPGVKQLQEKDIHDDDDFVWGLVVCVCVHYYISLRMVYKFESSLVNRRRTTRRESSRLAIGALAMMQQLHI